MGYRINTIGSGIFTAGCTAVHRRNDDGSGQIVPAYTDGGAGAIVERGGKGLRVGIVTKVKIDWAAGYGNGKQLVANLRVHRAEEGSDKSSLRNGVRLIGQEKAEQIGDKLGTAHTNLCNGKTVNLKFALTNTEFVRDTERAGGITLRYDRGVENLLVGAAKLAWRTVLRVEEQSAEQ